MCGIRRSGASASSAAARSESGASSRSLAVEVQHVEEEHAERDLPPQALEVAAGAEARAGDLERVRAAVLAQRDHLAVEHRRAGGQRQRGLDRLGHVRGHVVERAGEDGHVVAVAVDLHARAVELVLDRGRAGPLERGADVGRGGGEHGGERAPDLQPHLRQPVGPVGERDRGRLGQVAAERERAAHVGLRHLGGAGDRGGHHARERALAEVAEQQPGQEALLVRVGAREQRGERLAPGRLRAGAADRADRAERRVDLGDRQRRLGGGRRRLAQLRPADADLALGQPPDRNATAAATSSGAAPASSAAIASVLALRERVAATAAETSVSSRRRMAADATRREA